MSIHSLANLPTVSLKLGRQSVQCAGKIAGNIESLTAATPSLMFGADAAEPKLILSRREGPTQYLSLNDSANANRMNRSFIQALDQAFAQAEADPAVKQIVLESNLEKIFCPGADLMSEMATMKDRVARLKKGLPFAPGSVIQTTAFFSMLPSLRSFAMAGYRLNQRIAESSKPTIAKVNGYAIGGGMEMALACDYIVASKKAGFALPEVKYGIFPDWGGTERLPQRIGKTLARFVVLEGGWMADKGIQGPATLTADEAQQIGLADAVFDPATWDADLAAAMANGKFQSKVKRPETKAELSALDDTAQTRVAGTRLQEKFDRYRTATTDELLQKELKGLYPATVRLADRRVASGPKVSRWRLEKDLMTMFFYFATVMKSKQRKNK